MIDINIIRNEPDTLDAGLKKRGMEPQASALLKLDEEVREAQTMEQKLLARSNDLAKKIGEKKRKGEDASELLLESAKLKEDMSQAGQEVLANNLAKLKEALSFIPNIPAEDVPVGADENDNKVISSWGEPTRVNSSKEHHELGAALGMMSAEVAAKMSGARFTWIERDLARLERALGQFFLDTHTAEFGYREVSPPLMVREQAMYGTGNFPKFKDDAFAVGDGSRYLIPTAEVSLTNFVADEIVGLEDLPLRFTALTPCFREEVGSAGRDVVGLIRQHQFYKVEMVSITTPEQSEAEHQRMLSAAENVLKKLELPFRTMVLCTGDMGFSSRKTYDIEVWLPGQNRYREISSCSNCGDFQARRMNARFRAAGQKTTQFVHTLNGSGLAVGRALVAVMENYQQPDGSILVPTVLQRYMNGLTVIKADEK